MDRTFFNHGTVKTPTCHTLVKLLVEISVKLRKNRKLTYLRRHYDIIS